MRWRSPLTVAYAVFRINSVEFSDYPRRLEVDAQRAGSTATLFTGSYMQAFGEAMRRAPEDIRVRLRLAPTPVESLRFRQTGRTAGPWWWSIDDLIIEAP